MTKRCASTAHANKLFSVFSCSAPLGEYFRLPPSLQGDRRHNRIYHREGPHPTGQRAGRRAVKEALQMRRVPGDPQSKQYEESVPDFPNPEVFAQGTVTASDSVALSGVAIFGLV